MVGADRGAKAAADAGIKFIGMATTKRRLIYYNECDYSGMTRNEGKVVVREVGRKLVWAVPAREVVCTPFDLRERKRGLDE